MTNNAILKPQIFLIAKPSIDVDALHDMYEAEGVSGDPRYVNGCPAHRILMEASARDVGHASLVSELAGRGCYNSWFVGRDGDEYHENIINERHGSIYAHGMFTFRVIGVSRSLTQELARHQIGIGFSQESQRFVEASDINFVVPPALLATWTYDGIVDQNQVDLWLEGKEPIIRRYRDVAASVKQYIHDNIPGMPARMRKKRVAEAARSVLPNEAETRLFWSFNMRALRHVINMRANRHADLEILRFADAIYEVMKTKEPRILVDFERMPVDDDFVTSEVTSKIGGI